MLVFRALVMQTLGLVREIASSAEHSVQQAALREAASDHLGHVFSYIRCRLDRNDVADDLTSLVFVKAIDRLHTFDPAKGEIRIWLLGIARNLVRDHLRNRRRWKWLPISWLGDRPAGDPSPERQVLDRDLHSQLTAALATLSDRERDVLGLKFSAGLTNRAISRLTGLREGHVAVIVYRATGKLRALLKEHEVHRA